MITIPYDAFISHASEDKEPFVRPLARALTSLGARVWYDEFALKLGDSISRSIDKGLARSKYGIVVLSRAFFSKPWPQHELGALVTREISGHTAILPIWHQVSQSEVAEFSPMLADKLAVRTSEGTAVDLALRILAVIRPDLYRSHPRAELGRLAAGDALSDLQAELATLRERLAIYQCPFCGCPLAESVIASADEEGKHTDLRETFACGYQVFAGEKEIPCPRDPDFPKLDEYELKFRAERTGPAGKSWVCTAYPHSWMAHRVYLGSTYAATKKAARDAMTAKYRDRARLPPL